MEEAAHGSQQRTTGLQRPFLASGQKSCLFYTAIRCTAVNSSATPFSTHSMSTAFQVPVTASPISKTPKGKGISHTIAVEGLGSQVVSQPLLGSGWLRGGYSIPFRIASLKGNPAAGGTVLRKSFPSQEETPFCLWMQRWEKVLSVLLLAL